MNSRDQVLTWSCGQDRLMGILSAPDEVSGDLGVVIVVGGPQYRAGSHRQFVLVARALAEAGYPVLRFDYRGMGDSHGDARDFESVGDDIASAIDALQMRLPGIRRIVLWGLCDGASAALLYVHARQDRRLSGLCLLNPWIRSTQGLAKARVRHYYLDRLRQRDFWMRLLRGQVAARALVELAGDIGKAGSRATSGAAGMPSFRERMLAGCRGFRGQILVILSANDLTAQEFVQHVRDDPRWAGAMSSARVQRQDVSDADHTFSSMAAHRKLIDATVGWLAGLARSAPARVLDDPGAATIEVYR